jgi:hypothetical protein
MNNKMEKKIAMSIKSLPSEVITHICSFGYPEYKEHMKEIHHQMTGLLEYNLELLFDEFRNLSRVFGIGLHEYIKYAIDDDVLEDLFIQCSKCCCCSKHCHNRPLHYYTNEISIGENFEQSEECRCNCRHLARYIKSHEMTNDYKRKKKYRNRTTFNTQFIPLSSRIHPHRVPSGLMNPLAQP